MNFARKRNPYYYNLNNNNFQRSRKKGKKAENEDDQNSFNQKILDSIIDDNEEQFTELISQIGDISRFNGIFRMTNYKMPSILRNNPTYALLCAFFNAEKCYNALSMFFANGLESEEIKKTDDYGRGPMHFACAGGSLNIIRELFQQNYSLNDTDNEGCLPSHYAAMTGNMDVFRYLWMKGADLISPTSVVSRMTPLHVASLYGNLNIVKFICETVLQKSSDSKDDDQNQHKNDDDKKSLKSAIFAGFHHRYCKYSTPLHLACEGGHEDIVRYFLSMNELSDIQIESLDHSSRTPLIVACKNGSIGCVKAIVETGKVLKKKKKRKHYPLIDASSCGYLDIVTFLLKQKGVDIQQENSQRLNSLTAAIINDHIDVVKCLIEHDALKGYNEDKLGDLFLCACGTSDIEMVKYIDSCCEIPYTKKSNNKIFRWSRATRLKMDENTKWQTQYMQQACLLENEEIVLFLKNDKKVPFDGIDFSINASKKWSPFLDFLVEQGVNLSESVNSDGIPPIVATVKCGSLANVKKMIKKGTVLNADIISKFELVNTACSNGKVELFDFLMSFNPEIKNGEECIDRCLCGYGNKKIEQKIYMAEEILKRGLADVNKEYNSYNFRRSNETLVSRAVQLCSLEFLELFAKYNADFKNVPLRYDQLSLKRFIPVIDFLVKHGCTFNKCTSCNRNYYYFDNEEFNTPLTQSFYLINNYNFNEKFPLMLIDYMSDDEIKKIKCGKEKVIDKLKSFNCHEGILKIYQKCNAVIYPDDTDKDEYIQWINDSGNKELIDFVYKKL